ncbi:unnamed protein product [Brassica rapa subsp. narinosa]|uniref:(rape) hypothetical protein n=1 Tax=Brassica napus TaxID=3708 RepID=A0A816TNR6_BRANA|nr:unnamed protein product [Brassica napus]
MRPFSERVVGRPSRCTLPFLGTVRSFCHVPENMDFRLPLEGERAAEPPEGFFTLYEEHLMHARLWFPIPLVIVEFLNRLEVSISNMLNDHSLLFILPVFFNSSISVLRSFCSTQPHSSFSLRAAVEAHRSRFSSSIDNAMEASFEDTSLSTVYVTGRSSGRGSLDAEEDGEPIVEDPVWMD